MLAHAPSQALTEFPAGSLIAPVTTTAQVVASERKSEGPPARTLVEGSQTSCVSGVRNPFGPITNALDPLTVVTSIGPLNGTVTRGLRSKPSWRLTNVRSSQIDESVTSHGGTGRFTRRPVI